MYENELEKSIKRKLRGDLGNAFEEVQFGTNMAAALTKLFTERDARNWADYIKNNDMKSLHVETMEGLCYQDPDSGQWVPVVENMDLCDLGGVEVRATVQINDEYGPIQLHNVHEIHTDANGTPLIVADNLVLSGHDIEQAVDGFKFNVIDDPDIAEETLEFGDEDLDLEWSY